MKIELTKPITVKGKTRTEVEMTQPVLTGDWRVAARAAKGDQNEQTFHLVLRMCDLTESELEALTQHDFGRLAAALDFGDPDPKAPPSSSQS